MASRGCVVIEWWWWMLTGLICSGVWFPRYRKCGSGLVSCVPFERLWSVADHMQRENSSGRELNLSGGLSCMSRAGSVYWTHTALARAVRRHVDMEGEKQTDHATLLVPTAVVRRRLLRFRASTCSRSGECVPRLRLAHGVGVTRVSSAGTPLNSTRARRVLCSIHLPFHVAHVVGSSHAYLAHFPWLVRGWACAPVTRVVDRTYAMEERHPLKRAQQRKKLTGSVALLWRILPVIHPRPMIHPTSLRDSCTAALRL